MNATTKTTKEGRTMKADCNACGYQFDVIDETPVECPRCGKIVNYFLEDDDFRVNKEGRINKE